MGWTELAAGVIRASSANDSRSWSGRPSIVSSNSDDASANELLPAEPRGAGQQMKRVNQMTDPNSLHPLCLCSAVALIKSQQLVDAAAAAAAAARWH